MSNSPDAIIIGTGVIGTSIAFELSKAGESRFSRCGPFFGIYFSPNTPHSAPHNIWEAAGWQETV